MPIFTIEAPDGRKIKVEADTPELAMQGAEEYAAKNPIRSTADMQKGLQSGELRFSALSPDEQMRIARAEGSTIDNVGRQISKGVPFIGAWGDEINARVNAGLGAIPGVKRIVGGSQATTYDERVADNLAYERARDKAFEADNPITSLAVNVGGGIGGTLAAAPAVAGAGALSATGRALLGVGSKTLPGAVGRGMFAGVAQGAAAGAGEGEGGFVDRSAGALTGGAIGGAFGVAAPLAIEGIRRGGSKLLQSVKPSGGPFDDMSPAAQRYVRESLSDPDAIARQAELLRKYGPEAMLADVSPEWRMLARAGASRPGLRESVVSKIEARDAAKNARLGADLNRELGPAEDPVLATQRILDFRKAQDDINYPAAKKNAPPVSVQATLDLIDRKLVEAEGMEKKALNSIRSMLVEQREFPVLNPDGSPVMAQGRPERPQPLVKTSSGPKPIDLATFIKNAGGLIDESGDLKSLGLNKLINPRGLSLDQAREMAAEQGYLGANIDDAMANTYINDLLDALSSGRKVYSVYDQDRVLDMLADGGSSGARGGWVPGAPVPMKELREVPKDRVGNLHNIRVEIDSVLEGDTPGLSVPAGALQRQQGSVQAVRNSLDEALKTQVPGFREADRASAAAAARAEALKLGTTVFNDGKGAISPERFRSIYDELSPGERAALSKGTRAEIERLVGTKLNDPIGLRNVIKGEGDWNNQKLRTVFGEKPASEVLGSIDREVAFRDTWNRVAGNSDTAPTAQFNKTVNDMEKGMFGDVPRDFTMFGAAIRTANSIKTVLSGTLGKERANRFATDLARMSIATGVERDQLVEALQRMGVHQKQINRVLNMAVRGGLVIAREAPSYAIERQASPSRP